jgi:hypothetical protein
MSTVKVINVVHPSSATNNIVLDSSGNASFGGTMAMGSSFMRNRIINGAMVVDQRNAGASVTPANGGALFETGKAPSFLGRGPSSAEGRRVGPIGAGG